MERAPTTTSGPRSVGSGRSAATPPHVVVVGAGFAGLNAARRLAREARETPMRITLIDRHNYHTFQPLLYQVATSGLQPQDIGYSVRGIFGRSLFGRPSPVSFRMATVVGVDWDAKRLELAHGEGIDFDLLVLAAGASTNDYGIPGVSEFGFPLKSLHEAVQLRNHVLGQFERVETDPELIDKGALNFVIAGGGPTGVELSGAMAELVDHVIASDHPQLDTSRVRIILVEMLDTLLAPYSERSRAYTKEALEERGIEVKLSTAIEHVSFGEVALDSGERIPTRSLIWTAGVKANPLADVLDLEQTKGGRVATERTLKVAGRDAFVIGDLSGATDEDGDLYPQLAPVAIQQGKFVSEQIPRLLRGRALEAFHYVDKGTMATIGRHDAVTELPFGINIRGPLAWLAWLFLHLMYLVGFRNRIAVFFSWMWNYVTYDRSSRLIITPSQPEEDEVITGEHRRHTA